MDGSAFDLWQEQEQQSAEYAAAISRWMTTFRDAESKLFRISIQANSSLKEVRTPNSASNLIALAIRRIRAAGWVPQTIEWRLLEEGVTGFADAMSGLSPEEILPLRSFGVLPLFSTSYLAMWLPLACGSDVVSDAVYAIALRRVLWEMFILTKGHETSSPTKTLHPFLLWNSTRALQQARELIGSSDAVPLTTALKAQITDRQALRRVVSSTTTRRQVEEALGFRRRDFEAHLSDRTLPEIIRHGLAAIESAARAQLVTEFAQAGTSSRGVDGATIGYGLKILASLRRRKHAPILLRGLTLLVEATRRGGLGTPFYVDDKGRALFVPAVEIANALLSVAIAIFDDLTEDVLGAVLRVAAELTDHFSETRNRFEVSAGAAEALEVEVDGWCSDKAPDLARIDSWITIQVLEFFTLRLRLLRLAKKRLVYRQYNFRKSSACRPRWQEFQDPDEGARTSIKDIITATTLGAKRDVAPVFLLYGPPGTGKTSLVEALASHLGWDLLLLSPSDFVADSLDKVEFRSRRIFRDLMSTDKCVVLMDEMDSLFRDRRSFRKTPGTFIEYVIPAFLPKLQDLREYTTHHDAAVFYVSNYAEAIDDAIARRGRIDVRLLVLPYTRRAREKVLADLLKGHPESERYSAELRAALEHVPCNLVFRDMKELAGAIKDGVAIGQLTSIAKTIGIPPSVYDPQHRGLGAYEEFCWFVSRGLEVEIDASVKNRERALGFLQAAANHIDRRELPEWDEMITKWIQALRNPPAIAG